jgi:hypothetical protein
MSRMAPMMDLCRVSGGAERVAAARKGTHSVNKCTCARALVLCVSCFSIAAAENFCEYAVRKGLGD